MQEFRLLRGDTAGRFLLCFAALVVVAAVPACSDDDPAGSRQDDPGQVADTAVDFLDAVELVEPDLPDEDVPTDAPLDDGTVGDGPVVDTLTDGEITDDIADLIEAKMEEAHIPGLAAAVVMDGEVYWTGAYGWANIEEELPVTVDTPFMLASVSKTVTATALMQVVEDGLVTLDDPINDHLPFPVDNPKTEGEVILIRHLTAHTAAIQDNWDNIPYVDGDSDIALGDYLEGYLVPGGDWYDAGDNFYGWQPGTNAEYSNIATALAGYIVETVTETGFDAHCETQIFAPLGLEETGWHLADFDPANVAVPYRWRQGSYEPYEHYGFPDYPDGQLRASVSDLARFLAATMNGGVLDEQRILEEATVAAMLSQQATGVDDSQFVFWYSEEIGGRDVIGHNGGDDGVAAEMYFDPETEIGVIVLMNTDWRRPVEQAAPEIETALFEWAEGL